MKTYEVELRRTSYVVISVEAENEAAAEELAWKELDKNGHMYDPAYANWEVESIEEMSK